MTLIPALAVGGRLLISSTIAARRSARAERGPVWGWWTATHDSAPFGQRHAYAIKAGRFYAVAFEQDAIVVSKRLDSKRDAKKWVTNYVGGNEVKIGHRIEIHHIDEVAVTPGVSVEIVSNGKTYVFDSWFNRFDGQHHEELKAVVQRLELTATNDDHQIARFVRTGHFAPQSSAPAATGLLSKLTKRSKPISLGGGANMFDIDSN